MKKNILVALLLSFSTIVFAQPVADFNFTNVCIGNTTFFTDASTGATSWYWTFGEGGSSSQQNPIYNYSIPGNFTVTLVVGDAGVYDTIQKIVSVFPIPTINVSGNQSICIGTSTGLTASGGVTYNWSPSTGLSSSTVSNPIATPTSTTTYTVTVTDANGCVGNNMINITVNPLPNINAGADQVICSGDGFTPNATGGVSYTWDNGANQGTTIYPSTTTNYTVIGTDMNGCQGTDNLVVNVSPAIFLSDVVTSVSCNGGADGTITITPSGGIAPYTYSWMPNPATTQFINNLIAGTYTVTVTDANGCTEQLNSVVTEPVPLVTTLIPTDISCFGANDGMINSNTNGGTLPYSYAWSNGSTTQNISGLNAGSYNLTVVDGNGCTTFESTAINELLPDGEISGVINFQGAPISSGTVELIRKDGVLPGDLTVVDTFFVSTGGVYMFTNVPAGLYLVKAIGDTSLYNCAATYSVNTAQWDLADEWDITSNCSNDSQIVSIDLIELPVNSGIGTITGQLIEGGSGVFNKAPGDPLSDIDITVDQSPGGAIMDATITDINGYFTFNNLPVGTYTLHADIPGYGVTSQTIDVNATTSSFDVVLCTIDSINMIDMCEINVTSVNDFSSFENNNSSTIQIVDITGKIVLTKKLIKTIERLDISSLQNGMYFIKIQSNEKDFVQKLIVK
ncbi:MAG: carboxypeptidase regulatory-like domain-containing protein [Flavobacteriales bacterium]|nr:carboxypeptidase regulatory-like domain-containing protein [Flavobacteriales bacterium]